MYPEEFCDVWDTLDEDEKIYLLECDGFPDYVLQPLRDYIAEPVATIEKLETWLAGCK